MESPTMREAFEEIDRLSRNPETSRLAYFIEQELKDILQREEDAREEGIEKAKKVMVIRMHTKGMPLEDIATFTELAIGNIKEIIKSQEQ